VDGFTAATDYARFRFVDFFWVWGVVKAIFSFFFCLGFRKKRVGAVALAPVFTALVEASLKHLVGLLRERSIVLSCWSVGYCDQVNVVLWHKIQRMFR